MKYRTLGKTGLKISEISLGTWQVGGKWGSGFNDKNAETILNEAIDQGINFIDTADVYENGQSEAAVGKVIRSRKESVYIATKCGRFISPHNNEGYTPNVLRQYVEQSLNNTGLERIDLIQLHCPPTEVYYRPEIFGEFEKLQQEGKIALCTVQIIFNMFRHRPSELFFKEAKKRNVGIIARVPLASGLLTGKFSSETSFGNEDHRHFNRNGAAFDQGETFSGIDYELGLAAVAQLRKVFPAELDLVNTALKWILHFEDVSCVIPGVSRVEQLQSNLSTLKMRELTRAEMTSVEDIYKKRIRAAVHHRW